jgi:hypothetical protein
MAQVTTAETSSREGKWCSCMGSFNLWNKSKSGGLSRLDCMAHEVTLPTCIYLANQSQPSPGAGVNYHVKRVAHPRPSQVGFRAFFCTIFATCHDNTLLSYLFHMEVHMSWWFLSDHKQRSTFAWPLIALIEIFWVVRSLDFPLIWLQLHLQFKVSNPRFINSDNSIQECLTFNVKSLLQ